MARSENVYIRNLNFIFSIQEYVVFKQNAFCTNKKSTNYYGDVFEHFIILEYVRLTNYYFPEYRFSYIKTKNGVKVDLVVDRPGEKILCIEIKSTDNVREDKLSSFANIVKDIPNSEAICISQEPRTKKIGNITVLPWQTALIRYFVK